ncbi:putative protein serine/threonine kinase [Ascosphaera aggregata]|nr:putative protein serine/threonine kinase [Ascosphaera aggregata]
MSPTKDHARSHSQSFNQSRHEGWSGIPTPVPGLDRKQSRRVLQNDGDGHPLRKPPSSVTLAPTPSSKDLRNQPSSSNITQQDRFEEMQIQMKRMSIQEDSKLRRLPSSRALAGDKSAQLRRLRSSRSLIQQDDDLSQPAAPALRKQPGIHGMNNNLQGQENIPPVPPVPPGSRQFKATIPSSSPNPSRVAPSPLSLQPSMASMASSNASASALTRAGSSPKRLSNSRDSGFGLPKASPAAKRLSSYQNPPASPRPRQTPVSAKEWERPSSPYSTNGYGVSDEYKHGGHSSHSYSQSVPTIPSSSNGHLRSQPSAIPTPSTAHSRAPSMSSINSSVSTSTIQLTPSKVGSSMPTTEPNEITALASVILPALESALQRRTQNLNILSRQTKHHPHTAQPIPTTSGVQASGQFSEALARKQYAHDKLKGLVIKAATVFKEIEKWDSQEPVGMGDEVDNFLEGFLEEVLVRVEPVDEA